MRTFLVIIILVVLDHFKILPEGWYRYVPSFIEKMGICFLFVLILAQDVREAFGRCR